jgi:hypothetical protein
MVIGQTEKHTQNPRLKWIFFCSRGARGLRFQARKAVTVIVTNIVPELWKALTLPGKKYENNYV